jgi:hypothetical protein
MIIIKNIEPAILGRRRDSAGLLFWAWFGRGDCTQLKILFGDYVETIPNPSPGVYEDVRSVPVGSGLGGPHDFLPVQFLSGDPPE